MGDKCRAGQPDNTSQESCPNVYYDRYHDIEAAKLLPGEYYATARDMVIVTVLGSCISACIRDTRSQIGGMNHFMLPSVGDPDSPIASSARYGAYAMEKLINDLIKLGARRQYLEAKVFGGGAVMPTLASANIGERNTEFVYAYLAAEQIPVVASDVLDNYPRKVYFFARTGRVRVKKLWSLNNNSVLERELDYSRKLRATPIEGGVDLF
ncbi:MAG: chemotaxis protein CheD [unclassified Hahellaceae]|nr:chemotaxis protein CheD [Hahellaceae bacterium]|tara:strand:+ start:10407 stop:11036 length:630 start_codon:yes stop_codon:yes gene_type:complete